MEKFVDIKELKIFLLSKEKKYELISIPNLEIKENEIFGLVGESGSGKSVFARSLALLQEPDVFEVQAEKFEVCGQDLLNIQARNLRKLRAEKLGFIFQDPMSALNPLMSIEEQMDERLQLAGMKNSGLRKENILRWLEKVSLAPGQTILKSYPHELSGGMRQRVCIAMAMSPEPQLLIADEATTALDTVLQKDIVSLLKRLIEQSRSSLVFISHDLLLIRQLCSRVGVMYAGNLVELSATDDLFQKTKHPYTKALTASMVKMNQNLKRLKIHFWTSSQGYRISARMPLSKPLRRRDGNMLSARAAEKSWGEA